MKLNETMTITKRSTDGAFYGEKDNVSYVIETYVSHLEACFPSRLMSIVLRIQYISPRDISSGDNSPCSNMYVVREKPGVTLSAMRCFIYL